MPVPQTAAPAVAATTPELAQLEPMAGDLASMRRSLEQLAVKQEQMAQNMATLQAAAQDIRQKISSRPLSPTNSDQLAQATEAPCTFVARAVAASASTTGRSAITLAIAPGVALGGQRADSSRNTYFRSLGSPQNASIERVNARSGKRVVVP